MVKIWEEVIYMEPSIKYQLNKEEVKAWLKNALYFTTPALIVLFVQLSQGATLKEAWGVAVVALYGIIADLLRKINQGA